MSYFEYNDLYPSWTYLLLICLHSDLLKINIEAGKKVGKMQVFSSEKGLFLDIVYLNAKTQSYVSVNYYISHLPLS